MIRKTKKIMEEYMELGIKGAPAPYFLPYDPYFQSDGGILNFVYFDNDNAIEEFWERNLNSAISDIKRYEGLKVSSSNYRVTQKMQL